MSSPDWEALRTLGVVAETGSMARAGEQLGCAVSTVARRIDGLEQALGLTLLHRTRGGAKPTDAGKAILGSVAHASQFLNQVPRQAKHFRRFKNRQPVRISATETAINDILLPRIGELRQACPEPLIEFESTNEISSLEFGETDIAIRLAPPAPSNLITRKLPKVGMSVFISEGRLADRDPATIGLNHEDVIWIDRGLGDIAENRLVEQLGIAGQIVLRATSVRALAIACQHGQGMTLLPDYMGKDFGLVALSHIRLPAREAWLVYHPETRSDPTMRKVRRWVVKCFEERLRPPPPTS